MCYICFFLYTILVFLVGGNGRVELKLFWDLLYFDGNLYDPCGCIVWFCFCNFLVFIGVNMSEESTVIEGDKLIGSNDINHPLEKEIKKSYIEYAMAVIVSRALPDTRDGFKPVLRRILYAMYDMNMYHNTKHKKSARIVWEVLGKYHPHGDSSVYEAMVRMAQHRSLRYPLVDWQGNFGSIDGDSAAAMRYTEARLTKVAEEMCADIEQDTVDWRDNFDGSLKEPIMLPTKFPNHLCNGTMWIAVGMATNMAPHNLTEVLDASLLILHKEWKVLDEEEVTALIEARDEKVSALRQKLEEMNLIEEKAKQKLESDDTIVSDETTPNQEEISQANLKLESILAEDIPSKYSVSIDEIMQHIKWPDFPTGWYIFDSNNIRQVYAKWKGGIVMRGKTTTETHKNWSVSLIIVELPYMVNKSTLVAKIGELVVNKKIDGITDIRDESSKNKIRVVMDIKKWVNVDKIETQIYKSTDLQCNFNMNNVSLIDSGKQPRLMNIKDLLLEFVDFRRKVVYRRSVFQLKKAKDRLHILEWLKKAISIIDQVINTIKKSETKQDAKINLIEKFDFTEVQAEYILLMRLQSLVWLEIVRINNEIEEKLKLIEYLEGIVNDESKLDGVVEEEFEYMKNKYGDDRRTVLSESVDVYDLKWSLKWFRDAADKVKEDVIVRLGDDHTMKVLYQSRVLNLPENTIDLVYTHNQDNLIIITNVWELVVQRLKDFGKFSTQWSSLDLKKHFELKWKIIFAKTLHFHYDYLVLLTDQNNVKKIKKELVLSFKKFPTTIMKLAGKEKILSILAVSENEHLWVITKNGRMLLFDQAWIRPMWKTAWWVKAIELQDKDKVVNMFLYKDEPFILIHSDKAGKLLNIEDLKLWRRARKWQVVATGSEKLEWGISIVEGAIRIRFDDGTLSDLHSNDIHLNEPETPLKEIVKKKIDLIYRPWEEKDENVKYKEEKKKEEKDNSAGLFEEEKNKE